MALVGLVVVALAAAVLLGVMSSAEPGEPSSSAAGQDLSAMSVDARFAALSSAGSNRCDLGAAELQGMPDGAHLQGSCCFPMDRHRYAEQVSGLRDYAAIDQIPTDPYDVPVDLAKQLLTYRDIELTQHQRAVYRKAVQESEIGGPCCCPCWRSQAFRGQAIYLITRRRFSAAQVARVWDLEEGCGGTHEHAA